MNPSFAATRRRSRRRLSFRVFSRRRPAAPKLPTDHRPSVRCDSDFAARRDASFRRATQGPTPAPLVRWGRASHLPREKESGGFTWRWREKAPRGPLNLTSETTGTSKVPAITADPDGATTNIDTERGGINPDSTRLAATTDNATWRADLANPGDNSEARAAGTAPTSAARSCSTAYSIGGRGTKCAAGRSASST